MGGMGQAKAKAVSRRLSEKEKKQARADVIWRDRGLCIYCGRWAGAVHHIIPRSRGLPEDKLWAPKNMACICVECHEKAHNYKWRQRALEIMARRYHYDYSEEPWASYLKEEP